MSYGVLWSLPEGSIYSFEHGSFPSQASYSYHSRLNLLQRGWCDVIFNQGRRSFSLNLFVPHAMLLRAGSHFDTSISINIRKMCEPGLHKHKHKEWNFFHFLMLVLM